MMSIRAIICLETRFTKISPLPQIAETRSSSSSSSFPSHIKFQFLREPFRRHTRKSTSLSSTVSRFLARMVDVSGDAVQFPLSPTTSLVIQKGDITKWSIDGSSDAIVNPANEQMLGGGGADGAIHRAAGPELLDACCKVPIVRPGIRCPTGDAKITPGFKLPAFSVIHTVGPIYAAGNNPEAFLRNAYRNSLTVAKENGIKYIAFPAISCGVYGYPYDEAASIAISTAMEFSDGLKEVHFVLFSDDIYNVWLHKARDFLQK